MGSQIDFRGRVQPEPSFRGALDPTTASDQRAMGPGRALLAAPLVPDDKREHIEWEGHNLA